METLAEVGGNFERRGIKPIFWKLNRAHTKRALQPLKRSTSRSHKLISRSDSLQGCCFGSNFLLFSSFTSVLSLKTLPNSFHSFCQLLTALTLPGPAVRESKFFINHADDVSSRKSDLFCYDFVWVCPDFAPDLLFCSSVPGVRVLREPTVPPQWLAAFCSSALRSPWPPVITRTLPTRLKNS